MSILTEKRKDYCEHALSQCAYDSAMRLKDVIRTARLAVGIKSQSELARRCGVDPSAINHLENGRTESLSGVLMVKLSEVLQLNPVYLTQKGAEKYAHQHVLSTQRREPRLVSGVVDHSVMTNQEIDLINDFRALNDAQRITFSSYVAVQAELNIAEKERQENGMEFTGLTATGTEPAGKA